MTEEEIQRVEQTCQVSLPGPYRHVLLHYPFTEEDTWGYDALIDDAARLIELNRARKHIVEYGLADPERYFYIGSDGGESRFCIDLTSAHVPVYALDLETRAATEAAPNLFCCLDRAAARG
jgi:hypothetical protein